jgi:hypothetical protein
MTWTNAFTIGACSVWIYDEEGEQVPEASWAGLGLTVTEADGVVTVDTEASVYGWSFVVVPSYATNSVPVRVTQMASANTEALTQDGATYTPDPATFEFPGVWGLAGVTLAGEV